MLSNRKILLMSTVVAMSPISAAWAQDAQDDSSGLEEIVVTAQKRTQNLQDVPTAVSALSATQIEESFGRNISELGALSPNLIIDPIFGVASPAISIRGMQLNDGEKSFDPAVAVYLDGVYLASTTGALLAVFDAEAVEVLRGPQGTLFGRNTIGGLVHVRRKEPTGEMGGTVSATYGRFQQVDLKATLNLPSFADDTVSAKVSVVSLNGGGYLFNTTRNVREGDNKFLMFSAAIKYEPSDTAKLVINYDYVDDNTAAPPITSQSGPGELFCAAFAECGAPTSDGDFHRHPSTAVEQPQSYKGHSLIANGELEIGDGQSLVTTIAYRESTEKSFQQWDAVEPNLFYTIRPQTLDQFSAELRYQADFEAMKLVVGGFYYNSGYTNDQQTFFFGGEVPGTGGTQRTKNYALFGQLDWDITEKLNLSIGGRFINEEKSFCGRLGTGPLESRVLVSAYGDCTDEEKNSGVYTPDATNPVTGEVLPQTGLASWSRFTPRFGLTYQLDNGIAFVSYSEGFRSGGWNGRATDAFAVGPYDPEKVKNIEAGFKTQWADNRIRINVSAFTTKYQNKQEDVVFPDPVAITVTLVQNAAEVNIKGFEAEMLFLPVDSLTLGVNIGHLSSNFVKWEDTGFNLDPETMEDTPFVTIDKSNFKLRRAPNWTVDLTARYEYELKNDHRVVFNASYRWKDDYYIVGNTFAAQSPNPGLVESFGLFDASVAYITDAWKISVFGKNLGGTNYFNHVLDVGTGYGGTPTDSTPIPIAGLWTYGSIAAPATWGVELQFDF